MQSKPTQHADDRRLVPVKNHPGIYKRGNRYVIRYRDPRGRQRKQFARTLGEARDLRATLTADVKRGEYRALSRVTFREYAATWITTYAGRTSRGLREGTREDYARELGLNVRDGAPLEPERGALKFFGPMRLAEIEPRDVKEYAAGVAGRKVRGRPVSANTVRLALAPVKALLATAVEEGLIRSNPSTGLRLALPVSADGNVEPEQKVKAMTEEELARVLALTADDWLLFMTLLAQTAIRTSEALPLRWSEIDFGRRRLLVRRSLNGTRIGSPKTHHARRDVPLTLGMAQTLWNARKESRASNDDLIFPGRDGGFVKRAQAYRALKKAAKQAGVPWAGLHTLRHTAATILFRRGWNAVQVQKYLGHHSPAFTLATYVHLLPDDLPEPAFFDDVMRDEVEPRVISREAATASR